MNGSTIAAILFGLAALLTVASGAALEIPAMTMVGVVLAIVGIFVVMRMRRRVG